MQPLLDCPSLYNSKIFMEIDKNSEGRLREEKLHYNHVYCFIIGLLKLYMQLFY